MFVFHLMPHGANTACHVFSFCIFVFSICHMKVSCKNFGLIVTYEYTDPVPKSSLFAYLVALFHVYICKMGSLPPAAEQVFRAKICQQAQTSDAKLVDFVCSDHQ